MDKQRETAKKAMNRWIAANGKLGKVPFQTEYATEFDLHNLHYYVFRFQENMKSEWMLGVSGGYEEELQEENGHVFSAFQKYKKETEIEDAVKIVETIRAYWMKETKRLRYEKCFEENMEYISQTEILAETIQKQFQEDEKHFCVLAGNVDFPTGRIVISDPLAYLPSGKYSPELKIKIPKGRYPVYLSVYKNDDIGIRMCTMKLKIKNTKAAAYVCAEETEESSIRTRENELIAGFPVDAGMMTICDAQTALEYRSFLKKWYEENPDRNHYDDYFAAYFAESYKRFPDVQRKSGDFIEWENPVSNHRMVLASSGFGDGFYQGYIGYDGSQDVCEIIVPMINPELFEKKG